ncbi:PREDICTED: ATP synthase subunit e, mitochondrial, partial [Merops nubicus]|uniref:ATP synthase subunit e, mitochondrial n=1 Tax=Merops nubicus TaxID=57421 RepID=UPI0004F08123
ADYLKPIAEEERRVEAEEKKKREELERIAKELAEGIASVSAASSRALIHAATPLFSAGSQPTAAGTAEGHSRALCQEQSKDVLSGVSLSYPFRLGQQVMVKMQH